MYNQQELNRFLATNSEFVALREKLTQDFALKFKKDRDPAFPAIHGIENSNPLSRSNAEAFMLGNIYRGAVGVNVDLDKICPLGAVDFIKPEAIKGSAKADEQPMAAGCSTTLRSEGQPMRSAKMDNVRKGYSDLASVLEKALDQAQSGKGTERHQVNANGFTEQPICELTRLYGLAYPFGQAAKKMHEVGQLSTKEAKLAELLGAIVYTAAAYIVVSEQE